MPKQDFIAIDMPPDNEAPVKRKRKPVPINVNRVKKESWCTRFGNDVFPVLWILFVIVIIVLILWGVGVFHPKENQVTKENQVSKENKVSKEIQRNGV